MFDPDHPDGNNKNFMILRNFTAVVRQLGFRAAINFSHLPASSQDFSPSRKYIELDDGQMIKFDKLLIATGSSPKQLDIPVEVGAANKVTTFRTVLRPMPS